jgi:hypothetical protein
VPLRLDMVSRAADSGLEAFLVRPWKTVTGANRLDMNQAGYGVDGAVTQQENTVVHL